MPVTDIGVNSGVMVAGNDVSTMLNKVNVETPQDAVDITTFDPNNLHRFSKAYIAALFGGILQVSGFTDKTFAQAVKLIGQAINRVPGGEDVLVGVGGFIPGNLAFAIKSILTQQTGPTIMPDGAIALGVNYQATSGSPSIAAGKCLWNYHGADTIAQDTKFTITLTAATGNGTVTFYKADGTSAGSITVHIGDSAATIKAAIEALPYYNTVAVTGSPTGSAGPEILHGIVATEDTTDNNIGGTTANMTDGDTATYLRIAVDGVLATNITWDLGGSKKVNRLRFYTIAVPREVNIVVQGSANGLFSDAVTLATIVGQDSGFSGGEPINQWNNHDFTAGTYAKIRFVIANGGHATEAWDLSEVQLLNTLGVYNGTYTIDVQDPADVNLNAPTTSSTGYSTAKTLVGEAITGVNKVAGTGAGTWESDIALDQSTANGGLAVVQLGALDGAAPSVTITWETAPDSMGSPGAPTTIATLTAMTAKGVQRIEVAAGVTIHPWNRLKVTAISGEVAFAGAYFRYSD